MAFTIIRDNIINVKADAIVNTANPYVYVGKGVDEAIYEAAGREELLAERAKIGVMEPGQAAATPAFKLPAKYILHTVSPVWHGGRSGEREALRACYRNTLALAEELACESVAFPFLATGNDHFPRDEAIMIATDEINDFLLGHDMEVILVVYDTESFTVSSKLFSDIDEYIEANQAIPDLDEPYDSAMAAFSVPDIEVGGAPPAARNMMPEDAQQLRHLERRALGSIPAGAALPGEPEAKEEPVLMDAAPVMSIEQDLEYAPQSLHMEKMAAPDTLDERLKNLDKTFQEYLFYLIDRSGKKDPEVYKKANLTTKHFSKIRSDREYRPKKTTAVALALALELNLDETQDLLMRAGYTLSNSSLFDVIITYCIEHEIYNVVQVNIILEGKGVNEFLGAA